MPVIPLYCLACYVMAQDWVLYVCLHYLQSGSQLAILEDWSSTNNYAFNPEHGQHATGQTSLWSSGPRRPEYRDRTSGNSFQSFFSYATHTEKDSTCAFSPSPLHLRLCK